MCVCVCMYVGGAGGFPEKTAAAAAAAVTARGGRYGVMDGVFDFQ